MFPFWAWSATRLDNASLQEASYLKERRVNIVVRLLAESLVVVLLMALGWWGMTTLGSDSLQPMSEPIYVAGCPQADTLQKGSGGGLFKGGRISPDHLTPGRSWTRRAWTRRSCALSRKGKGKIKSLCELLRRHLPRTLLNKV